MNELLHLLTNRDSGYAWTEFPSLRPFYPKPETEVTRHVREFMGLHRQATDYFVMGALMTLASVPEFHELFDPTTTYDLKFYAPPVDQVVGGQLLPDSFGPPYIKRVPAEWPANQTVTVSYLEPALVKIAFGDRQEIAPCGSLNGVLHIVWPQGVGVRGGLKPDEAWAEGSVVQIEHTPAGLPYSVIVDQLSENLVKDSLLTSSGMRDSYVSAQNDRERVAALLTGLALETRRL